MTLHAYPTFQKTVENLPFEAWLVEALKITKKYAAEEHEI